MSRSSSGSIGKGYETPFCRDGSREVAEGRRGGEREVVGQLAACQPACSDVAERSKQPSELMALGRQSDGLMLLVCTFRVTVQVRCDPYQDSCILESLQ